MIALIGLIVGIVLGVVLSPDVPTWMDAYLPVAVIAGLDAVSGALRSMLDGNFSDKVFVVSFLGNVAVASVLVWLGDQLGVGAQMSTGVVVVLAMRIFANAAAIRRKVFKA
ncbi:MAG: small basic family protein [Candidatus Nanopelagicales bacterium]|nr:small basic family protein [Candidatus Nanopelagicales bacterium]MCU0294471.1 small basic family protein [Candidatus Nanopelagicales bacterium]MCU0296902.1 small basic family protein [Candidatus Nanopelagicales bacterium]